MKKLLLILSTLLIATIGYSQTIGDTFVDDFITYEITSLTPNTVEAITYNETGGPSVAISDTVTNNNLVFDITTIASSAFHDKNLINVSIGNNVLTIANAAFFNNQITSLTIGNSVTSIGLGAFQANNLTMVVIPDNVTNLENQVFAQNDLTDVTIGTGIITISQSTFLQNNFTTVTIPNHVTTIESRAFDGNSSLTSLTLGTSVSVIGDWAFRNNPLTCVISQATTPPTITTGANDTFSNRQNINLSIPTGAAGTYTAATWTGFNSVAEGLTGTFTVDNITYQINATANNEVTVTDYNIAGGTVLNIPATVNSGCTDFSVTDIGDNAFDNKGITSVTIPDSVISIGFFAFSDNALTSVIIPNNVISISVAAFLSNNLDNLVIGNNVTTIDGAAFRYNSLTNVTIPGSVTSIGQSAFHDNLLTDVFSESTTPPTIVTGAIPDDTFSIDRSGIHLHIPAGTMGAYVTDAGALWTGFNPVTEDALVGVLDFGLANDIKVITSKDHINISFSNNINLQNYTVYSLSGSKMVTGKENEISTNFLSNGVYIIKLDFDKGTYVKKIIVY